MLALLLLPLPSRAQQIGTITATLGGRERTWYVVSGRTGERPQPGAFWMALGGGEARMGVVGGYDRPDIDFDSFEFRNGQPVSLGSYEGSMLSLAFPFQEGAESGTATGPSMAQVSYLADASGEVDFSRMLLLQEGAVEVTRIETGSGGCRFEGTFHGTLAPLGGEGERLRVTDGRFRVDGCREMRPGG